MDLAVVVPEYTPAELPLHQIFKSFPTGPSDGAQVVFFRRVAAEIPAFQEELAKENVVPILFATGYPVAFFSTRPLDSLEDIRGEKWRSASFWHQEFLRNAGAVPVTMPWGEEISQALRAGLLDGLMVNVDSGYDIHAPEVAPHVLMSKNLWLGHVYLLVMNKNVWEGLPEEDREAVRRAAETTYQAQGQAMARGFDAIAGKMGKDGVQWRLLDSQELTQWENATRYREAQAVWAKEQEEKGIRDAAAVLEKVTAIHHEAMRGGPGVAARPFCIITGIDE